MQAEGPVTSSTADSASICVVCQTAIRSGDEVHLCPGCGSPHHAECWQEIGGCATYGCEHMPAPTAEEHEAPDRVAAWGDFKECPRCHREIRAAAIRCRHCRASFPSAVAMSGREYLEWTRRQKELRPTREIAVVVFLVSLLGFAAPILFPAGLVWARRSSSALRQAGGVYQVLAYFGVGLSALYCLMLVVILI